MLQTSWGFATLTTATVAFGERYASDFVGFCNIVNYTVEGRVKKQTLNPSISKQIQKMLKACTVHRSIEYTDNRISRYSMQMGKCAITGYFLEAEDVNCHHKVPIELGGKYTFQNLIIVHKWVHQLIHAKKNQTINKYLKLLSLSNKKIEKVNKYREICNLTNI